MMTRFSTVLFLGLVACGKVTPPAPPSDAELVAADSFSGPAGSSLNNRVATSGHVWRQLGNEPWVITADGYARPAQTSSEGSLALLNWQPTSPDYAIEARLEPKGLDGDGWQSGLLARVSRSDSAAHGVVLGMQVHDSTFRLELGSSADTASVSTAWGRLELRPYVLTLAVRGDSAIGLLDGTPVLRVGLPVQVAEGVAGIVAYQEDPPADTNGLQFDEVRVYAR